MCLVHQAACQSDIEEVQSINVSKQLYPTIRNYSCASILTQQGIGVETHVLTQMLIQFANKNVIYLILIILLQLLHYSLLRPLCMTVLTCMPG